MSNNNLVQSRERIKEWIGAVAANGSLSGAACTAIDELFDKLIAHDAANESRAQPDHGLLTGTHPDGRHYGLHGTPESVEAVSDLIEIAEQRLAQPACVADEWVMVPREFVEFVKNAPVGSGVCGCGDSMENHSAPTVCGHSPVDQWDASLDRWMRDIDAAGCGMAGLSPVPTRMTTEIEDEMVRVWNHGPHAVLAAIHRASRRLLTAAPQPPAQESVASDALAKRLYSRWTDNQGIHCNRFPSWLELSEKARDKWRAEAANQEPTNDR